MQLNITYKTTRKDMKSGQVFEYVNGTGGRYMHIGSNGRFLAWSVDNNTLVSRDKDDGDLPVRVVGSGHFTLPSMAIDPATRSPAVLRQIKRNQVNVGEVFRVKGKDTLYIGLGVLTIDCYPPALASYRIGGGPDTENNYSTKDVDRATYNVETFGVASINVTLD